MASGWMTATAGLLISLRSSCASSPSSYEEFHYQRVRKAVRELNPSVQALMQTGPFEPEVYLGDSDKHAATHATRDEIIFGWKSWDLPPDGIAWLAAHELVHVYCRGHWATLPDDLEEGLCHLVSLELVPGAREHARIDPEFRAAYRLAKRLGIERLRELALKASEQGLAEIPEQWLSE